MNYTIIKKLPTAEAIMQAFPLSSIMHKKIMQDRAEIKAILEGRDRRFLIIVGPCSAWPKEAVISYAKRLLKLNEKVHQTLKLVMRVYIEKPRTTKGWAGPVNQCDLFAPPDISAGMQYARDMMVKIVGMGLPIADEALFIQNARGFFDLLSWIAIGARSTSNQEHRIFASAVDCPVGLKNPTHGSLEIGINSVIAAQQPHVAAFDGYEVQTKGNPHAHLVLRGANQAPNYATAYLENVRSYMEKHQIKNPAIIVDASHDNCLLNGKKDPRLQPTVISNVLACLKERADLRPLVKGFMLESFIKEGQQVVDLKNPGAIDLNGLSITDPCLGWEETEKCLLALANEVYGGD